MDESKAGCWYDQRRILGGATKRSDLGFPLGTLLFLFIVVGISGLLSWCYHWEKIKSLYVSFSFRHASSHSLSNPTSSTSSHSPGTLQEGALAVVMPGDNLAKFIACPRPMDCKSLSQEN